ncbi:MAG: hypothetical protein EOP06_31965 [Proteobacteria bacterium]|nr:MAG: hypothetical protein EOP06_31965 [Pseudomonadota bacterium]
MSALTNQEWRNYEFQPSFVLGFHGCDETVGEDILSGRLSHLSTSTNDYDWLGRGIYFWEGNPARALEFAEERAQGGRNSQGSITHPFVLGAVINLKRCLDLADSAAIQQVQRAHSTLEQVAAASGSVLPTNGKTLKARRLDCLVFNTLHRIRADEGLAPFDTVRGLFLEGDPIYPNAGVLKSNHIQICVRDRSCILGYFRPIKRVPELDV